MPDISEKIWRQIARSLALSAILALGACAPSSTDLESRRISLQASATAPGPQICRADRALLVPPNAPDCGFGRSDLKTLDPDQWGRLKVEYERKCYQNAEQAIRERLRRLQAANRCEADGARS